MSAAYLRSNEAQRTRWAYVFNLLGMNMLGARVVMADAPDLAPRKDHLLDMSNPSAVFFNARNMLMARSASSCKA